MIGYISGEVIDKADKSLTIIPTGIGLGYVVGTPIVNNVKIGDKVSLYVKSITSDIGTFLYGFETVEDRYIFEKLISVQGVGGKTAIDIITSISPATIADAIVSEDSTVLARANGIGKKTAEKIVFTLKDKLRKEYKPANKDSKVDNVIQALMVLGYSKNDAVTLSNTHFSEELSVEEIIKKILIESRKNK